jgi:hypothetical protein
MQNAARSIAYVVATLLLATLLMCANSSPWGEASADPAFRLLGSEGEGIAASSRIQQITQLYM